MVERILFVDDEAPIRRLVSDFLRGEGYEVTTADDGLAALAAVMEDRPDLVISDVNVPGINGLELTRRLRAHHTTARIPILMLSAHADPKDLLTGYAEGADDY